MNDTIRQRLDQYLSLPLPAATRFAALLVRVQVHGLAPAVAAQLFNAFLALHRASIAHAYHVSLSQPCGAYIDIPIRAA